MYKSNNSLWPTDAIWRLRSGSSSDISDGNLYLNSLQWRHNERDSLSNHQPHDCLFNCLFRRSSKKTSKLSVTGLCDWNSPVTGEFPAQRASNAENVSIWWRHHVDPYSDVKRLLSQEYRTKCKVSSHVSTSWFGNENIVLHLTYDVDSFAGIKHHRKMTTQLEIKIMTF